MINYQTKYLHFIFTYLLSFKPFYNINKLFILKTTKKINVLREKCYLKKKMYLFFAIMKR